MAHDTRTNTHTLGFERSRATGNRGGGAKGKRASHRRRDARLQQVERLERGQALAHAAAEARRAQRRDRRRLAAEDHEHVRRQRVALEQADAGPRRLGERERDLRGDGHRQIQLRVFRGGGQDVKRKQGVWCVCVCEWMPLSNPLRPPPSRPCSLTWPAIRRVIARLKSAMRW